MNEQKRNFVRVSSDQEQTIGVGVWRLQPNQERPDDVAALGVAHLSHHPDQQDQLSLLNVSAGGLCLRLKLSQEGKPPLEANPGDRLICLVMLRRQTKDRSLPFWLDCTVMNRREEEDGLHCAVGLHFHAWAAPQPGKTKIEWFSVGDEEAVGPLGSWVMREQLAHPGRKA
ncbi:MAG: PilZ domain-containing protein [Deltaproteobacteria bacterium]|jgi:hypothetical protein|nr:PilZ domain-containing protein [Deltaproteobacteria bacterium]